MFRLYRRALVGVSLGVSRDAIIQLALETPLSVVVGVQIRGARRKQRVEASRERQAVRPLFVQIAAPGTASARSEAPRTRRDVASPMKIPRVGKYF